MIEINFDSLQKNNKKTIQVEMKKYDNSFDKTLSLESKNHIFSNKMEKIIHLSSENKSLNHSLINDIKKEVNNYNDEISINRSSLDKNEKKTKDDNIIVTTEKKETIKFNLSKESETKVNEINSLDSIKNVSSSNKNKYKDIISDMSSKYSVPEKLIYKVIETESNFNSNAVSGAGAQGLMQLMPSTAKWLGVNDSFDPAQNIEGGVKYLRKMLDKYDNDTKLALAAYNAGPGNVDKYNGVPPFKETQNYIKKILG